MNDGTERCPGCGEPLAEDEQICSRCGYDRKLAGAASLREAIQAEMGAEGPKIRYFEPDPPKPVETSRWPGADPKDTPRRRTRSVWYTLGTVLVGVVILAVAAGAALWLQYNGELPRLTELFPARETAEALPATAAETAPAAPQATIAVGTDKKTARDDGKADEPETTPRGEPVYVQVRGLNLRSGPGTGYSIVDAVSYGTELELLDTADGWSLVFYDGRECYAAADFLGPEKPAPTEPPAEEEAPLTEEDTEADASEEPEEP